MMKDGVSFILIAFSAAELFKVWFMQIRGLMTSLDWQNIAKSQKMECLWRSLMCRTETLCSCYTHHKFHGLSFVTFPWQNNGLQALDTKRVKWEFPSFKNCYLPLIFIQRVQCKYGHYTAHALESLSASGATNKALFILGR